MLGNGSRTKSDIGNVEQDYEEDDIGRRGDERESRVIEFRERVAGGELCCRRL